MEVDAVPRVRTKESTLPASVSVLFILGIKIVHLL